jgi:hypothetical protein
MLFQPKIAGVLACALGGERVLVQVKAVGATFTRVHVCRVDEVRLLVVDGAQRGIETVLNHQRGAGPEPIDARPFPPGSHPSQLTVGKFRRLDDSRQVDDLSSIAVAIADLIVVDGISRPD